MKKFFVGLFVLSIATAADAQIDVFTIVGKKADGVYQKVGFGGFIKYGFPVNNDADEITAELALIGLDGYDLGFAPMKAGYRYTFNRTGYGFYIEPQVGYAIGGDYDETANGFVGSANLGYLFQPWGSARFDLALRYENIFTSIGTYSFLGIRLAHNFSFGRRTEE